jgi:hypothetical protein
MVSQEKRTLTKNARYQYQIAMRFKYKLLYIHCTSIIKVRTQAWLNILNTTQTSVKINIYEKRKNNAGSM